VNSEQLNAIKERVAKATQGPWEYDEEDRGIWNKGALNYLGIVKLPNNDAKFIAHSREDVPALVGEVERLRKVLSYYADEKHYEPYCIPMGDYASDVTEDNGEIARQALVGESSEH